MLSACPVRVVLACFVGLVCFLVPVCSFAGVIVSEDFSSDPFLRGWETSNTSNYFWNSTNNTLQTENYTNIGGSATIAVDYNGESFRFEYDVRPAERDTGDVTFGLLGPNKLTNHNWDFTEERCFVLLGGYNHEVFIYAVNSAGIRVYSPDTANLMVDNEWHHIAVEYDAAIKSLSLDVTRGGTTVVDWQTTMNHGFTDNLGFLGTSMNGAWVTDGRWERAYIDNVLFETTSVPEPTSLAMWAGLGVMGLIAARRRRKVA